MAREIDPVTLRLFVAVCEERNIARAAAREAIVASAVSKRIGALEGDIGTALLVRGRRGIEPTAAGELLLRQARELLDQMVRLRSELIDFAGGVQGSVRLLASVSTLAEHLPDDVAAFSRSTRASRSAWPSASAPASCVRCGKARPISACCGTPPIARGCAACRIGRTI